MKLIYCPICGDVARLIPSKWRQCECGLSGGQYNADLMTATIGGSARVFGVGNPFFNEFWTGLSDEMQQAARKKYGYGGQSDCWWGEYPGDQQIFRIESPDGPRLQIVRVEPRENNTLGRGSLERQYTNEVFIVDRRDYTVDGKRGIKSVVVPANPNPSFHMAKAKRLPFIASKGANRKSKKA